MKVSGGIIILNEVGEIFVGHSNGNTWFDLPKGEMDAGESAVQCAIRETREETSLEFKEAELLDLGLQAYNKEKSLHLFLVKRQKSEIDISSLVCNSFFEHRYTKKMIPEVDSFKWLDYKEVEANCAKSMSKLLNRLIKDESSPLHQALMEIGEGILKEPSSNAGKLVTPLPKAN